MDAREIERRRVERLERTLRTLRIEVDTALRQLELIEADLAPPSAYPATTGLSVTQDYLPGPGSTSTVITA